MAVMWVMAVMAVKSFCRHCVLFDLFWFSIKLPEFKI
jgi:hypothetical protein